MAARESSLLILTRAGISAGERQCAKSTIACIERSDCTGVIVLIAPTLPVLGLEQFRPHRDGSICLVSVIEGQHQSSDTSISASSWHLRRQGHWQIIWTDGFEHKRSSVSPTVVSFRSEHTPFADPRVFLRFAPKVNSGGSVRAMSVTPDNKRDMCGHLLITNV